MGEHRVLLGDRHQGRAGETQPRRTGDDLPAPGLATNHFTLLGIELAHATCVENLPAHHKDPFDRLLVAQALIENMPLVSADAVFDQYGVTRLWK